jgi:hydroxymethylpyrimidine/phosphomethylpyrimidine kinase
MSGTPRAPAPTPAPLHTAIALTIAGSDSSGGAGIQADLKTFSALGVYGASVIVALTAQNTRGVQAVEPVRPEFVAAQLDSVLSDLDVGASKTGMLANAAIVETVARAMRALPSRPLIVDPVMVATSGDVLLKSEAVGAIKGALAPLATLITPNLAEAAVLLGGRVAETEAEMRTQAVALLGLGCRAVLVKGGHGSGGEALDVLADGSGVETFASPRINTLHTHGTGCTLSAAVAALMAEGAALADAVRRAKDFVWHGLQAGRALGVGSGPGPVDHLFGIRRTPTSV